MEQQDLDGLSPEAKALFELHGQGMLSDVAVDKDTDDIPKDKEDEIIRKFDTEILEWEGIIRSLSNRMRDITKCVDVQCDLYDKRHAIVDRKHKLLRMLSKFNQKYKEERGKRLSHYAVNSDRKLASTEREKMADADMSKMKYRIDLLENHVNQIDQTFKLIENMIFGLKHRVELEDYLRKT